MALFDFLKGGYQSKTELRTINRNLESRITTLENEIVGYRELVTKKNNRIIALEGELRETRIALSDTKEEIIALRDRPQPKRRRYSHRGANGKFAKAEVKQ